MLSVERREKIVEILHKKASVTVKELSSLFNVTDETIRRDMKKLQKENLISKSYGGATLKEKMFVEENYKKRQVTNLDKKSAIASKILEYIKDGDTIFLDSSSTNLQIARQIDKNLNVTIITNSVHSLLELSKSNAIKTISTGGMLRTESLSLVGPDAVNTLSNYYVDKVVIGCDGISMEKGITEYNNLENQIKKAMVSSGTRVFLTVDSTKFNKVSFIKSILFEEINVIVTDSKLSDAWEKFLADKNIELIYCDK